jgi:predicted NBD/HSP70 family sugar kinase
MARKTGLSEAQVSRLISSLIKDKLVRESGTESSTGGRPGRRLELEPARVAFGAEIQIQTTRCSISNVHGDLIESRSFPTPLSAEKTLEKIAETFFDFRDRFGTDRIAGAGLCTNGIIDHEAGTIVVGASRDWINVPVRQILEARLREPVFVSSDVRAAALAEYNYGWRGVHGSHCFLYVEVDEDVRIGIILDGKVYQTPRMAAGRLGKMVMTHSLGPAVRDDPPQDLDMLVSSSAVCAQYVSLPGHQETCNWRNPASGVSQIARRAKKGDACARQVIEDAGRYLGLAVANVAWALDPEVIVINGAIINAWQLLESPLLSQLESFRGLLVVSSALKGQAALIGAAMLPFPAVAAASTLSPLWRRSR